MHIMARAVVERFPMAQSAGGEVLKDHFYYDFELKLAPNEEDFQWIERRIKEIINGNHNIKVWRVTPTQARTLFSHQPYKLTLVDDMESLHKDRSKECEISICQHEEFIDLAYGMHVTNTRELATIAFKLIFTDVYPWRGEEFNPVLMRINATAWQQEQALEEYLQFFNLAKRRDHRRLGQELELFIIDDLVGAGLPLWLPQGATIRQVLTDYILAEERRNGYLHVYTPHFAKADLYEKSEHLKYYRTNMFPLIETGDEQLVLRPMNCPHHALIYRAKPRSYAELPLRIAELGTMYRHENPGLVSGLRRVRMMTLNDAHIFIPRAEAVAEIIAVLEMIQRVYTTLGIDNYIYALSLPDSNNKEAFVIDDKMWQEGEGILREALTTLQLPYLEAVGKAAFYGPKIDILVTDAWGRWGTSATVQVDFHLPQRFGLSFTNRSGQIEQPLIIHRAVISSMERMVAHLIEVYEGEFPLWLAPTQIVILPLNREQDSYAHRVATILREDDFRVQIDISERAIEDKHQNAAAMKVPYILRLGKQEAATMNVGLCLRNNREIRIMPLEEFRALLHTVSKQRLKSLTGGVDGDI